MLIAVGAGFLWFGLGYRLGTARSMGPGYFPVLLSVGLIVVGAILAVKGLLVEGAPMRTDALRPLIAVIGSVLAFAFLISRFGFVAGSIGCILVASFATRELRPSYAVAYAIAITVVTAILFILLLGLPMQLFIQP